MQFRAVKGMNDLLPADLAAWQRLEAAFARQAELHGFFEVRTPIVEPTSLFVRSIGEVTDVVQKEMYTFSRGDESLTLRPEGTAGCARAYLQHAVHSKEPITRWYYRGPMFRAERPQRGRYRQFYQAGAEIYGDPGPFCDAELIAFLVRLFEELRIAPLVVKVNSIGGAESRARYRQALVDYLRPLAAELSELSQQRLETNPLRVLDSKNPKDQELVAGAPSTLDALLDNDRQHFDGLCAALNAFEVPYQVDTKLVRGLDYYTRTVFEVQTNAGDLGAQNTIAAGGRYDALIGELGGPSTPAIGFAMGMERILLAMGNPALEPLPFCTLLPLGTSAALAMAKLAGQLRAAGIRVELDARELSLKSRLRRADSMGARCALVMGDTELERGMVQLKDLSASSQAECPLTEAVARVAQQLTSPQQAAQNPAAPVERDA
jgi:histidyl-tRNA synthetase